MWLRTQAQPAQKEAEVEYWILPGFSPPRCLGWAQMGWRETSKATRRQNLREKGPLLVHCCHDLIRVHTDSILSVLPPPVSLCAQSPNSSLGLYAESAGTRGCATVTAGSTWNSQGSQGSGTPALLQAHCTNPPPSPPAPPGPLCTPSALPPRV